MSLLFGSLASHNIHASRQVDSITTKGLFDNIKLDNIKLAKDFILKRGDIIISWTPPGEGEATQDCSVGSVLITLEKDGVLVRILQGLESPSSTLTSVQRTLMHLLRFGYISFQMESYNLGMYFREYSNV